MIFFTACILEYVRIYFKALCSISQTFKPCNPLLENYQHLMKQKQMFSKIQFGR